MFYNFAAQSVVNPFEGIQGVHFSLEFATETCLFHAATAHSTYQPQATKIDGMWWIIFKPSDVLKKNFNIKFFDNSFTDGKLISANGKWMRFSIRNTDDGKFLYIS